MDEDLPSTPVQESDEEDLESFPF
ncbi:hypothetical protein DFA_08924 [Cavenderia fasciculata]|uniref:Uncharacterized protein n=1 Tax=Cavenderia fasciculata TaxID=261658 RepID=F4Q530_CACFS|nr:hypothetical protein DFA_08924 [Cavenderia fasciculata]EGG17923.1 hypothetical protein DFA_08924 [Cavenderia fasciculata]|eukprot:XP_004356407.1 hypothetical protein DFA_08924 [Cavenderia fasciculata]